MMKRMGSLGLLASSVLLFGSSNLYAAGFITKSVDCPGVKTLVNPGGRIEISDVSITNSNTAVTEVELFFGPPRINVLVAFLPTNGSFVSNFKGQVESLDEQGLKVDCEGEGQISVTVSGTRVGGGLF